MSILLMRYILVKDLSARVSSWRTLVTARYCDIKPILANWAAMLQPYIDDFREQWLKGRISKTSYSSRSCLWYARKSLVMLGKVNFHILVHGDIFKLLWHPTKSPENREKIINTAWRRKSWIDTMKNNLKSLYCSWWSNE